VAVSNKVSISTNLAFSVQLSSPTAPGQLVAPTNQVVTIINNKSGVNFSTSIYTVSKSGVFATINAVRSGYLAGTVSVDYSTADGTAHAGTQYYPTNGTLIFSNGQTSASFQVTVIDSTGQQPNTYLLLQLSNPTTTLLLSPSIAKLVIFDSSGSLVVPAGSALVSESGPANGLIDPNETVTLLFSFRDSAGTNVASLNAVLLATNGISAPSGPQNYGPLIVHGPSAFRPFTFTVAPGYTNGQEIAATFNLFDGANSLGTGVFTYKLGSVTTTFANSAAIVINDNTSASPYPSFINVSGVGGTLIKATVTLTNLSHDFPADVDVLLVDAGGTNALIMANSGTLPVSGVTLIFDDAATSILPQFGQIVSGTNKPTAYLPVKAFP